VIRKLIKQIACAICDETAENFPPEPPESLGRITIVELRSLLEAHFPQASIHLGDADYQLTSCEEYLRFLKWYHDSHPYTWDAYDCEVFAWVMRAEALKWMHGEFIFGHIISEGLDEEYSFPNHGFNFVLNNEKKLYFCDELCVAAPRDGLMEMYPVRAYKVET